MNAATPLILASASPRRRELLAHLGVPFTVLHADIDETIPDSVEDPAAFARALAEAKARSVAARYPGAAVLAADTIVVDGLTILGKPETAADARSMLQTLRGRSHEVTTGLALVYESMNWINHATTTVHMRAYTDEEMDAYIATGDPYDKAGSYAIQDRRFSPVASCEGCYCNVVGLPIVLTRRTLDEASLTTLNLHPPSMPPACRSCPLNAPRQFNNPFVER
jgi:septum formation protein